jgi:patatin-related protein
MRHKELRIALVCYGGISLAVYMHGVTKELWTLLRASRAFHGGAQPEAGSAGVYGELLQWLQEAHGLRLSVLTDIVAGASAGGINSVFLAQAIHSGQSLDPLTDLWLSEADIDVLLDPDARPGARTAKFWMSPVVNYLLQRPGNGVSASVAPETREEVRDKLSRLIRSRWFEPPFSGIGLARLLTRALEAMAAQPAGAPLLPPGHPLDLFVTATDFGGRMQPLRLHSPELVHESEHRLSIGFRGVTPRSPGEPLAPLLDLVFAARATSSFPGAFPPLQVAEIERLAEEDGLAWSSRDAFLARVVPEHVQDGDVEQVALIDGSVLVNAPFADAMAVLRDRPAHREVDRRFVYIDPTPDRRFQRVARQDQESPGFVSTIFGAISAIPREQPIRDNLEALEAASREMVTLNAIIESLRPEIEEAVEKLFGRTLFLDSPTPKRLAAWRTKAHQAAWEQAGFAYHGYAQIKFAGIVSMLARTVCDATPRIASRERIGEAIAAHFAATGLDRMSSLRGNASPEATALFREHDLAFRIRRLRLLARRAMQDRHAYDMADDSADRLIGAIQQALALYQGREPASALGADFPWLAGRILADPGAVIAAIAERRGLQHVDAEADALIADALGAIPGEARRHLLLTYLGFAFYDTVTLPLLRGESATEFNPAKVDRISPDDCHAFGQGATLRGTEFYNFGAFFSRAYRENDYLWGRLHGAERLIALIASTLDEPADVAVLERFQREAFLAILDEEEARLTSDPDLIASIRAEVLTGRVASD